MTAVMLPSGPPGHWLLGNLPEFRRDLLGFLSRCANDFGDFVPLRLGQRRPILLTEALIRLFQPGNEEVAKLLLDTAVELIDEYMTAGMDESIFGEPTYKNDLNAYLKTEQLGKTDQTSPNFRSQLNGHQKLLGRADKGSATSPRDRIKAAIQAT